VKQERRLLAGFDLTHGRRSALRSVGIYVKAVCRVAMIALLNGRAQNFDFPGGPVFCYTSCAAPGVQAAAVG
jgi:hypothetical protein